jgi:hypothetical protein
MEAQCGGSGGGQPKLYLSEQIRVVVGLFLYHFNDLFLDFFQLGYIGVCRFALAYYIR